MQIQRFNFLKLVKAFLRELFSGLGVKEQRIVRPKLDARLTFILSQTENELRMIRKLEASRLGEIHQEIISLQQEMDAAETEGDLDNEARLTYQERFDGLEQRLFSPLTSGVYFHGDVGHIDFREPHISALILSDASYKDLMDLGAQVRSQEGDIFTADIPFSKIPDLEASAAVRFIELAPAYFPSLDDAVPFAQINALHSATPTVTGSGVVVGIIDTELDIYHPDFRTDQGPSDATDPTRVLFLWDQFLVPQGTESGPPTDPTLPGFLVGGTTYGVEYDQADINTELANYNPPGTPAYQTVRHGNGRISAHGTHVTGIAAGNGRGDNTRMGAAPDADIIYVRYGAEILVPLADSSFVMDAFSYVFARASVLGQPCVINFSSSRNMGPHDGTSLGELFLDNLLLTPGRAITIAAGNTDNKNSHAAGQVASGATTNLVLNYFGVDTDADGVLDFFPTNNDIIEIWYDGHDRFTVTVTAPTTPVATIIGPVGPGASQTTNIGGGVQVQVTSTLNDPRNGDNVISIIISTGGNQIPLGNWTIALTGTTVINGNFQAWVERNNRFRRAFQAPLLQAGQLTIGSPATGRRTIAVGNHNKVVGGATPTIYVSSSRGPTRDSRIKPEVAATGAGVSSARSRNMNVDPPGELYTNKWGTSMASPLVAGSCALLFECRGAAATWADLKQILTDTAGNQGTAAGAAIIPIPSNEFGFGYLQMATACVAPPTDVDVWLRDHSTDTGLEPFTGGVAYLSPDIEILDAVGAPVPNPTYHPTNRYNNLIRVTVRNLGTQPAHNTEVYLYWGDPATNIPFPAEWRSIGIYTDGPNYLNQGNKIVVPQLAGGATTQVLFAWAPPAPGSNIRGDDHFCLLARLENESDGSNIGSGGWAVIRGSNNIALRNVNVQPMPTGGAGDEDSELSFYAVGTDDIDSLVIKIALDAGVPELTLPVRALPWRDIELIERIAVQRNPYGIDAPQGCLTFLLRWFPDIFRRFFPIQSPIHPLERLEITLAGTDVQLRTDVEGAGLLQLREGNAMITGAEGRKLYVKHLCLAEGEKMPASLRVRQPKISGEQRYVHIMQLSGGQYVGGVTLELRPREDM